MSPRRVVNIWRTVAIAISLAITTLTIGLVLGLRHYATLPGNEAWHDWFPFHRRTVLSIPVLLSGTAAVIMIRDRTLMRTSLRYLSLLMLSVSGSVIIAVSENFVTLLIGTELIGITLYSLDMILSRLSAERRATRRIFWIDSAVSVARIVSGVVFFVIGGTVSYALIGPRFASLLEGGNPWVKTVVSMALYCLIISLAWMAASGPIQRLMRVFMLKSAHLAKECDAVKIPHLLVTNTMARFAIVVAIIEIYRRTAGVAAMPSLAWSLGAIGLALMLTASFGLVGSRTAVDTMQKKSAFEVGTCLLAVTMSVPLLRILGEINRLENADPWHGMLTDAVIPATSWMLSTTGLAMLLVCLAPCERGCRAKTLYWDSLSGMIRMKPWTRPLLTVSLLLCIGAAFGLPLSSGFGYRFYYLSTLVEGLVHDIPREHFTMSRWFLFSAFAAMAGPMLLVAIFWMKLFNTMVRKLPLGKVAVRHPSWLYALVAIIFGMLTFAMILHLILLF